MTFALGLTGSIGMGKSTTAAIFAEFGCDRWDADAAVHRLYAKGGAAIPAMAALASDVVVAGAVDRNALRSAIQERPSLLQDIEAVVHPLVAADRAHFLEHTSARIAVLEIPLLFETGAETTMDAVACVWVSTEEQERRVLARGTMSRAQFLAIREKQMPIGDKLARADYKIHTDTPQHARLQVKRIVDEIEGRLADA